MKEKDKLPLSGKENVGRNNKHTVHNTAPKVLDFSETLKEDKLNSSVLPVISEIKTSAKDDFLKANDLKCEIKSKDKVAVAEEKNVKKEKEEIIANKNNTVSKVFDVNVTKKQDNNCTDQNMKNNKKTNVEANLDPMINSSNIDRITFEKPAFPDQEPFSSKEVKNNIYIPDQLDKAAIIISSEILYCSQPLDENTLTSGEVIKAESTKPRYTCMKIINKSQPDLLPHQASLDREAIKLSNNIFSDTTKMTQEEMQKNQEIIDLKQVKVGGKFENERSQEAKEQSKPTLREAATLAHARQCFIVNNPLKSSGSASSLQTDVKGSLKDINSGTTNDIKDNQEEVSFSKSLKNMNMKEKQSVQNQRENAKFEAREKKVKLPGDYTDDERTYKNRENYKLDNKDAHKNRPENLGPSRFERTSPTTITTTSRAAMSPSQEFLKPVRNATFTNLSKLEQTDLPPLTQSSSFAFERKMQLSPKSERKFVDRNFNASPVPFTSGKYSVHFSEPDASFKTSANLPPASLTYKYGSNTYTSSGLPHSNAFPSQGHNTTVSQSQHSRISSSGQSPKRHSNSDFRAKSDSPHMSVSVPGNTYSMSNTAKSSSDLYRQIQATKDMHRENCEKALSFTSSSKPPVINHAFKLPRPGNDYARYTAERDKIARRQERERTVIERVLSDRSGRATSLENKHRFRETLL